MDTDYIDINPEYTLSRHIKNNIYLSLEQIEILEDYQIDYRKCQNLRELIRKIEEVYNETNDDILYNILDILEERNYYQNFNK